MEDEGKFDEDKRPRVSIKKSQRYADTNAIIPRSKKSSTDNMSLKITIRKVRTGCWNQTWWIRFSKMQCA